MKYLGIVLLTAASLCSCSSNFYEYKGAASVKVYDSPKGPGSPSFTLPAGETVVVKKSPGAYRQARYKDYYGWVNVDSLQVGKRSNAKRFGNPEDGFVWDTSVSPTGTGANAAKPARSAAAHNGAGGHSYGRGSGNGMHHRQG